VASGPSWKNAKVQSLDELAGLIARHVPSDGVHEMPIPGLALVRAAGPTAPLLVLQEPSLCVIAQGAKVVMLNGETYRYDAATHLVVSVGLPLTGQVVEACAERPYLAIRLDLDLGTLNELMLDLPAPDETESVRGLYLAPVTSDLTDTMVRLLRLLDRPQDAAVLGPLIRREAHYRLLTGPEGAAVRRVARADGKLAQIARAIAWIKANFDRPFRIETVAREAGMSPSALHQHFKVVTAMSPLQYQKQLRLQEARRLMVGEARDAQAAGFEVGYESPSQFTREYARLFGAPPARDAARLRASGRAAVPA
jgi:AraC-like DNA-binding protein